jgi:hypothetical protein
MRVKDDIIPRWPIWIGSGGRTKFCRIFLSYSLHGLRRGGQVRTFLFHNHNQLNLGIRMGSLPVDGK